MTGRETLLDAVNTLEVALAQSAKLGNNLNEHRKEVVQLRRVILAQNSVIGSLCDEAFEKPERREAFRREFSQMRSAMAFHQASWPVVAVDLENPDYIASVNSVRDANRRFITWVRTTLAVS